MAEQLPVLFEFRADQTFADFFAAANAEAVCHLQQAAAGGGERQIFIWGESGIGKSHLLQAACHHAHQQRRRAFYLDLGGIGHPEPGLLDGLEQFELVCADGVEAIAGDPGFEEALFHFYNRHRHCGGHLLLSARHPPEQLPISLADLKTRLGWGLTLRLKPLTDHEKAEALAFKARRQGFSLSAAAARFLLAHCRRDLASLWTVLARLERASLSAQRKLTIPFLKQALKQQAGDGGGQP